MRSLCAGATRAKTETSPDGGAQLLVVELLELRAGDGPGARPDDAEVQRDRRAVTGWSPVIMMVRTPARCASSTATDASARGGSMMPTRPR